MERTAQDALSHYPISAPTAFLIRHNENETYRVDDRHNNRRYLLRIHRPGIDFCPGIFRRDFTLAQLAQSEMELLGALADSSGLSVQAPVLNLDGRTVTILDDGTPATLVTWVEGETLENTELTDQVLHKVGETAAALHSFFRSWPGVGRLCRPGYDRALLQVVRERLEQDGDAGTFLPDHLRLMSNTIQELDARLAELDALSSPCFVHADLSRSNLLFSSAGQVVPIDFSLCGFGHFAMDIGSLISHFDRPHERRRILDSYSGVLPLPEPRFTESFFVYQLLLYLATHGENAPKWSWFPDAMARWSRDCLTPFCEGRAFIAL